MNILHKNWREYSIKELNKIKREKCLDCPYSKRFGSSGNEYKGMDEAEIATNKRGTKVNIGNIYCDYLTMTDTRRGCRPEVCEHNKDKVVVKNVEHKDELEGLGIPEFRSANLLFK